MMHLLTAFLIVLNFIGGVAADCPISFGGDSSAEPCDRLDLECKASREKARADRAKEFLKWVETEAKAEHTIKCILKVSFGVAVVSDFCDGVCFKLLNTFAKKAAEFDIDNPGTGKFGDCLGKLGVAPFSTIVNVLDDIIEYRPYICPGRDEESRLDRKLNAMCFLGQMTYSDPNGLSFPTSKCEPIACKVDDEAARCRTRFACDSPSLLGALTKYGIGFLTATDAQKRKEFALKLVGTISVIDKAAAKALQLDNGDGSGGGSADGSAASTSTAQVSWTPRDYADKWCSKANINDYNSTDSNRAGWVNDPNHGWRWCSITVDECKAECNKIGGCAEIYYTQNGCCFPAKKRCQGNTVPGGTGDKSGKYKKQAASTSTAQVSWTPRDYADNWCSKANINDYASTDSNRAGWAKNPSHGWRWCGITVDECKAECNKIGGCAEIYYAQNGCCFPAKKRCTGKTVPGGFGDKSGKYKKQANTSADTSADTSVDQYAKLRKAKCLVDALNEILDTIKEMLIEEGVPVFIAYLKTISGPDSGAKVLLDQLEKLTSDPGDSTTTEEKAAKLKALYKNGQSFTSALTSNSGGMKAIPAALATQLKDNEGLTEDEIQASAEKQAEELENQSTSGSMPRADLPVMSRLVVLALSLLLGAF